MPFIDSSQDIVPMPSDPRPTTLLRPPNEEPVNAPFEPLPANHTLVLKVIPMPSDANANGDIFGGWVMAQVDLAGSVLPARYAQGRMATVAVNQFIFKQPVRVGDILSLVAKMERIGRTSMTVNVGVCRAHPQPGALHQGDRGAADLRGHRRGRAAARGAGARPGDTAASGHDVGRRAGG
jgi:acyl-CoA hydrolase